MMFQDPYSSLNPRMTVFQICAEPLLVNGILRSKSEMRDRVSVMLEQVGLDPNYMTRYPHAFSGGQRQRIAVARSLILDPEFVVADEPVSALDVSIQAQILNLLQRIKRDLRLTYLFIAHNLAVIQHVSDRVAVMYMGKIVETADTDGLFERPLHPYSEALLSAVPITDPDATRNRIVLRGEVGNLLDPPGGCYFHPRCNYAQERCTREEPLLREIADKDGRTHIVACHFAEELTLRGIEE
jgi:peptide/nickel transport system ATP-binding protein